MKTLYRIATPDDAVALVQLNTCFNGPGCQTTDGARTALQAKGAEMVFVAVRADAVVGFLCAQQLNSFCYTQPTVEFTELYVAEQNRRQGVAGSLMAFAEQWYKERGVCAFRLLTGADNHAAQSFYTSQGYQANDEICYEKDVE